MTSAARTWSAVNIPRLSVSEDTTASSTPAAAGPAVAGAAAGRGSLKSSSVECSKIQVVAAAASPPPVAATARMHPFLPNPISISCATRGSSAGDAGAAAASGIATSSCSSGTSSSPSAGPEARSPSKSIVEGTSTSASILTGVQSGPSSYRCVWTSKYEGKLANFVETEEGDTVPRWSQRRPSTTCAAAQASTQSFRATRGTLFFSSVGASSCFRRFTSWSVSSAAASTGSRSDHRFSRGPAAYCTFPSAAHTRRSSVRNVKAALLGGASPSAASAASSRSQRCCTYCAASCILPVRKSACPRPTRSRNMRGAIVPGTAASPVSGGAPSSSARVTFAVCTRRSSGASSAATSAVKAAPPYRSATCPTAPLHSSCRIELT
mmetsp:Transcript_24643/g.49030  ORF Transcript_24643/g.49030 Transcript_24643/m.49030 type:complete len:380 (-) Transcript_24643:358-1497(-)